MPFVIKESYRGVPFEGSFSTKDDMQECLNAIDLFVVRRGNNDAAGTKAAKGSKDGKTGKVTEADPKAEKVAKPETEKSEPTQEELDAEGKAQKEAVAEANRKAKAEKEAREKAEAAEAEKDEEKEETAAPDVTLDEVRAAVVEVNNKIGSVRAQAIVKHFEVAKISELPQDRYAEALAMANAELAKLDK